MKLDCYRHYCKNEIQNFFGMNQVVFWSLWFTESHGFNVLWNEETLPHVLFYKWRHSLLLYTTQYTRLLWYTAEQFGFFFRTFPSSNNLHNLLSKSVYFIQHTCESTYQLYTSSISWIAFLANILIFVTNLKRLGKWFAIYSKHLL